VSEGGRGGGSGAAPVVVEYKVRWKGYTAADDTWEPLPNLEGCAGLIKAYEDKRRARDANRPENRVITSTQKLLSFIKSRPEVLALAGHDQVAFLAAFGWQVSAPRKRGESAKIDWDNSQFIDKAKAESQFKAATAAAQASDHAPAAVPKLMLASHISGGFWLQLPSALAEFLPPEHGGVKCILECGDEWEVVWLRKGPKGGGLSGGEPAAFILEPAHID
jgi:hypothetical protein